MGVVCRDGDWRLEKQDDGLYEVTYDGTAEVKIVTSDYSPGMIDERYGIGVPVREVDSFSEVESLFEEKARSGGFGFSDSGITGSSDSGTADGDDLANLEGLPPGGFALALIGAGAYIMYISGFTIDSLSFLISAAMILIGIGIFG